MSIKFEAQSNPWTLVLFPFIEIGQKEEKIDLGEIQSAVWDTQKNLLTPCPMFLSPPASLLIHIDKSYTHV